MTDFKAAIVEEMRTNERPYGLLTSEQRGVLRAAGPVNCLNYSYAGWSRCLDPNAGFKTAGVYQLVGGVGFDERFDDLTAVDTCFGRLHKKTQRRLKALRPQHVEWRAPHDTKWTKGHATSTYAWEPDYFYRMNPDSVGRHYDNLRTINCCFGDLNADTQNRLKAWHAAGGPIQYFSNMVFAWYKTNNPSWSPTTQYRTAARKKSECGHTKVRPSGNWQYCPHCGEELK